MHFAAFFRNLNLGRPRCPTRQQFEQSFVEAGAGEAASFLTNGTIAFEARSAGSAKRILARARKSMRDSSGLEEPAFLREFAYLQRLVAADPFAAIDRGAVYDCYVTFLHDDVVAARGLPPSSPRGDVELIQFTGSEALCVAHKLAKSPGSPNAFVEKTLALPATTRAWNTVVRLVAKHGLEG